MIRKQATRQLYESKGPGGFVREMCALMGLVDRHGNRSYDHAGNPRIITPLDSAGHEMERLRPEEFSLRDLAESIIGEDWERKTRPDYIKQAMLYESQHPVMETGTGPVSPADFADINAFTAVVTGLLEISLMEGWRNPMYIADQIAPAEPTRMFDGRKVIGTIRAGDAAEERNPGMPTKRAQIGERWITQPRTVENALACEVTQEAVFLDLTGQVVQEANDLGTWLGWRKDIRCIDAFIGVTNTYTYKGNSYNTYLTNSTWNNDIASNELLYWSNIQTIEVMFRDMLDPDLGTRVLIVPNTILVNREKLYTAQSILQATNAQYRGAPGSTSTDQQIREFNNPLAGKYTLIESPLVYQRCTDASGLALSASNAGKYYWVFEKGKPLKYAQNWPLRIQQAAPNQLDMIDRGVVLYVKADERGVPFWYEPRRVVRSKP